MCTLFWGWGKEDDALKTALQKHKIKIIQPKNIGTNNSNTFLHIHDVDRRPRDIKECFNQRKHNVCGGSFGLNETKYSLENVHELLIDGAKMTLLNVITICNTTETPWCDPNC